ncbi:MAG: IS5 family transposase [Armatimonadota bacterium]
MESKDSFDDYRMPDAMWEKIKALLPVYKMGRFGGRPRKNLRSVADAIFYRLRTGCQWKAIPTCLAPGSTAHSYFQEWVKRGVFSSLWEIALELYDELVGLDWRWQSVDGAMTKSPLGGEMTGKNPTDRGKLGTKRSMITEAAGIPTGLAVGGANVHDIRLLRSTLVDALMRARGFESEVREHLCMDKGYDSAWVRSMVENIYDYIPHIRSRGEEKKPNRKSRERARRWVVERTHSWINRFRAILVRWDKKIQNHVAGLHLACAYITFKRAGVFG